MYPVAVSGRNIPVPEDFLKAWSIVCASISIVNGVTKVDLVGCQFMGFTVENLSKKVPSLAYHQI